MFFHHIPFARGNELYPTGFFCFCGFYLYASIYQAVWHDHKFRGADPKGCILISVLWKSSESIDIWLAKKLFFRSESREVECRSGFWYHQKKAEPLKMARSFHIIFLIKSNAFKLNHFRHHFFKCGPNVPRSMCLSTHFYNVHGNSKIDSEVGWSSLNCHHLKKWKLELTAHSFGIKRNMWLEPKESKFKARQYQNQEQLIRWHLH